MNMRICVGFFTILISSWALAHEAHHHEQEMNAEAPVPGSSIYNLDSEWTDAQGKKTKLKSLGGKPALIAMVFTKCDTACPLIVEDLKDVVTDLPKRAADVLIFSIDSERDTPQALREFYKKRDVPASWKVFTSNAGSVAELAAVLGVRYKKLPKGDFIHSNLITFINSDGVIVARKEGIKSPRKEFLKQIRIALKEN